MLNHIDYIVARIGIDHVGIGTDFNHGSGIEGFDDASEALNVTTGLLAHEYNQEEIEKIWGGNFLRVWRQAEALAGVLDEVAAEVAAEVAPEVAPEVPAQ